MGNRKEYMEFLVEWLAPLGAITTRSMFGGHTIYCGGIVFALVSDDTLYLKVDGETRATYEALSLEPFRPYPDKPEVMQFYPPPAEFFEDQHAMQAWGGAAVEVGRRAALKRKTPARAH